MHTPLRSTAPALVVIALAGCATGPSEIFRTFNLASGSSITTDAKQRVVTNHRPSMVERFGQINPQVVVCAEPSPDVATTIANSFGVGLSVGGKGSVSLSDSQVQSLLQLSERTVSIQLLRDQMYRACEAYSNGAINGTNYTLIMNRLNDTMLSLMMGETAGGAFGRSLGALTAGGSAEASAALSGMFGAVKNIDEAAATLAQAEKDVADKSAAYAADKQALDDWKCPDGKQGSECDTAKKPVVDKAAASLTARDNAIGKRDAMKQLLTATVNTATKASITAATATAGGGITGKPDEKIARVLAKMHKEFIRRDPSQALVDACLVELTQGNGESTLGASQTMFDIATAKVLQKGQLQPEDGHGALIGARAMHRSGLYEFCRERLAEFSAAALHTREALLRQENEIDARELAVREIEERRKAADVYVKCGDLADKRDKVACREKLVSSATPVLATPPASAAPAAEALLPYSPTVALAVAKAASEKLGETLAAMTIPAIPAGKDTKEITEEKAALDQQQGTLATDATKARSEVAQTAPEALTGLETTYVQTRAALVIAQANEQPLAKARLQVAELELKNSTGKLEDVTRRMQAQREKARVLKAAAEAFNAKFK